MSTTPRTLYPLAAVIVLAGFAGGWLGLHWLFGDADEPAPHGSEPAAPAWSLAPTDALDVAGQTFRVEHAQVGDDGTEVGYFSAQVHVDPMVAVGHDSLLPDGTNGDAVYVHLSDEVATSDVVKQDPLGAAVVGWEIDLAPLPDYGYQTISGGVAHFDNGDVTAERGTSYQLVFEIPAGAHELEGIDLTFDWLDQGRELHFVP
jgi:hypothetical protein